MQFEENSMVLKELRERYKGALQEIKDLEEEHENDHAELLNTVREQEHEIKLLKGMLEMLLTDKEIKTIRRKSMFDEETQEWEIPYFQLQKKEISFPKLSRNKAKDMIDAQKDEREVRFNSPTPVNREPSKELSKNSSYNNSSQPSLSAGLGEDSRTSRKPDYTVKKHHLDDHIAPTSINPNLIYDPENPIKSSPRYKEILHNKVPKKQGKLDSLDYEVQPPNPLFDGDGPIDLTRMDKKVYTLV